MMKTFTQKVMESFEKRPDFNDYFYCDYHELKIDIRWL